MMNLLGAKKRATSINTMPPSNMSARSVARKALLAGVSDLSGIVLMIGMLVGIVVSRRPFQAALLDSFDAVNYALAIDHFDMSLSQPQAPGYPLYVLLSRAFYLIFHDHLAALVWLSTVFSGLAVVAMYLIGKEMFGRRAGIVVALLLGTSTLFWYMGEIAAPYTADVFASAIVGWLCYRLTRSTGRSIVWVSALSVGLAGALRLQTLVFLFPLFLYAVRNRSWREIVGATAVVGIVFGSFFWPAVMASGGISSTLESMRSVVPVARSVETVIRSAKWTRYVGNAVTILRYTLAALGELVCLLAVVGYLTRSHPLRFWNDSRLRFLIFWALPAFIVYFLIWPGNVGTILVCMPPFFLLAAAGVDWIMDRSRWELMVGRTLVGIVLVWQVLIFTVLPYHPLGETYRQFYNYAKLQHNVDYFRAKLSLVSELPAENTIVYANLFRHLQYYLPEYRTFSLPRLRRDSPDTVRHIISIQEGESEVWSDVKVSALISPETERIVFFDLPLDRVLADTDSELMIEERSKDGHSIQIVSLPEGHVPLWTQDGLLITAEGRPED